MNKHLILADEAVINKIYLVRGKKIMLDSDLAELYGVQTKVLKQAVKRNIGRFPQDFMFELTPIEWNSLRSQIVTLKTGGDSRGRHSKYLPFAFTEQGVAMLSSVLGSKQAIAVNIQIIRVFTRMREILITNKDILAKLERMEKTMAKQGTKLKKHEEEIELIFQYLKKLLDPAPAPRKKIGYKNYNEQ